MAGHRYQFQSTWRLDAAPDDVYRVISDVDGYPSWWPQIRHARRIDERSGEITCRSLLPYDLVFQVEREIEDPVTRVLRGRVTGDLIGVSQWTIAPDGTGTVAVFDEDVTIGNGLLRAAGLLARPALKMNHAAMMRAGEAGLRKALIAASR